MKGSWSENSLCFMQGPRGRSGLKGDRGDTGEPVSGPRKSGKKNWGRSRGGKNVDQEGGTANGPNWQQIQNKILFKIQNYSRFQDPK